MRLEYDRSALRLSLFLLGMILLFNGRHLFSPDLCSNQGDMAANSLQVLDAGSFREMLGPYSRYKFHHPGPISFYYWALAEKTLFFVPTALGAYNLGQLLLNMLCFGVIVAAHARVSGSRAFAQLLGLVLFIALYQKIDAPGAMHPLWEIWGPLVIMLPIGVVIYASAFLGLARWRWLPVAAAATVVAVHNHVSAVMVTLPPALIGLILGLARERFVHRPSRPCGFLRPFLLAAAIVLVTSVPPLIEELGPGEGNITKLFHYWRDGMDKVQSWGDSYRSLMYFWIFPLWQLLPDGKALIDFRSIGWQTALMVISLAGVGGQFRRHGAAFRLTAFFMFLVFLLSLLWTHKVQDKLVEALYLFHFVTVVVAFCYACVLREVVQLAIAACRLQGQPRAFWRRLLLGLGALTATVVVWVEAKPVSEPFTFPADLVERFDLQRDEPFLFLLEFGKEDHFIWDTMAHAVVALERDGYQPRVIPRWGFLFNRHRVQPAAEPVRAFALSHRELTGPFHEPVAMEHFLVYEGTRKIAPQEYADFLPPPEEE